MERTILPKLFERYGERLRVHRRDVGETRHFEAMMGFEMRFGLKPQEVPEFYTDQGVTWDPKKLAEELPALIERTLNAAAPGPQAGFQQDYLRTGGTGITVAEVVAEQYGSAGTSAPPLLRVHEFRKAGCRSCGRVTQSYHYMSSAILG